MKKNANYTNQKSDQKLSDKGRNCIDPDSFRTVTHETDTFEKFLDKVTNESLCLALVKQEDPNLYIHIHYASKAECVLSEWGEEAVMMRMRRYMPNGRKLQMQQGLSKRMLKLLVSNNGYLEPAAMIRYHARRMLKQLGKVK